MNVTYIHTNKGLSMILEGRQYTVPTNAKNFQQVLDMLKAGFDERAIKHLLDEDARRVQAATRLSPNLTYSGSVVLYKGQALHNYAVDKLMEFLDAGLPIAPLANFIERVMANPSFRVVEQLYKFLEFGGIPLTPDGKFMAYKAIRADWKDIHSGKFDNSIGATCEVPRNRVDEDPERTCSYGLHVCSFDYLPHFAHANGHVVLVEVDPADVVAIPADYNNTKMRVAKYKVVKEVVGYYRDSQDVLRQSPIYGLDDTCSPPRPEYKFKVEGRKPGYVTFEEIDETDDESEAEDVAEDALDGEYLGVFCDYNMTRVVDNVTGKVLSTFE